MSRIMRVRDTGTADEYLELMATWGGRFPLLPSETDNPEWIATGQTRLSEWIGPEHEHGIANRYFDRAELRIASRGEPGEVHTRPPFKTPLMAASSRITSIEFEDDVRALAREGTFAVEVKMPVVYNNGMEREEGFLMLWSEQEQNWLPYMRFTRAEKKAPNDRKRFYMSFF